MPSERLGTTSDFSANRRRKSALAPAISLGSPSNLVFVLLDITSEEWSQSFCDERLHNQTDETCESSGNQTSDKNLVASAHGRRYPTSEKDAAENDEPCDAEMPQPKRRPLLAEHLESTAPHDPAVSSLERRQLRNLSVCEVEPHSGLTTKRTDELHLPVLIFQIDVNAAHSVPR
ncbi:MAG TPA: hypothetical protein VKY92_04915 [Verrucomicrobiae bacterium]|jgi:hypothetical protein|nr:hypothetical protein [Verrucomicrobiae bacterium]